MTIKEHPILMNAFSVRAILDGRKTQTRRPIKPQPPEEGLVCTKDIWVVKGKTFLGHVLDKAWRCPYGQPGDHLWVRETWACAPRMGTGYPEQESLETHFCIYRADMPPGFQPSWKWRPSIHMPRWASRITLEVLNERVERLQDITHSDAIAEGVPSEVSPEEWNNYGTGSVCVDIFAAFWDSIYAKPFAADYSKRMYGWNKNPRVWIGEFERTMP